VRATTFAMANHDGSSGDEGKRGTEAGEPEALIEAPGATASAGSPTHTTVESAAAAAAESSTEAAAGPDPEPPEAAAPAAPATLLAGERPARAPFTGPAETPFLERIPWATVALGALLVVMFAVELLFGVSPTDGFLSPSVLTLIATGGSMRTLVVDEGEWYRLFTAAFLHGNIVHLLCNGVALAMAGTFLENVLGRTWFLALFVVGALGGSAVSLAVNPSNVVSVGASGAIMALLAAGVVVAFRVPAPHRGEIQGQLLRILIPSLLPIFAMRSGAGTVDYGAHLGGAAVGALAGWLLLRTWQTNAEAARAVDLSGPFPAALADEPDARPRFTRAAQLLTAAGVALFAIGFFFVQRGYSAYLDIGVASSYGDKLMPDEERPSRDTTAEQARALAEKYPHDPRALLIQAAHLLQSGDVAAGKAMLQRALGDTELLRVVFPDRKLEIAIRGILIKVLLDEKNQAEAEAVAAPICGARPDGGIPEDLLPPGLCK
jgi:rhomboid protease GluP